MTDTENSGRPVASTLAGAGVQGVREAAAGGQRFADFRLSPDILETLLKMGIEVPTPIQLCCIPAILEGKDVVGKAETGTGKTIGFGAPLVGKIDTNRVAVQALVLTPTRELAQQVAGVIEQLGAGRGLKVALVVGGVHASEQIVQLRSGSQVVVGTPGRVLDFLRERTLSLVWCETVVLDEADRMLDMGFIDDVSAIIEKVPVERQTLLFSATIPPEIEKLLRRYMKNPAMFSTSKGLATVAEIEQLYVEAEFHEKFRALRRLLDSHTDDTFIIFCNTRRQAIDLDRMLWGHGYSAGALHGEQEQDVRFKILESFRRGEIKILVATDVASRGLDVEDVAYVINYEIPEDGEGYVHRIGRTGRAQKRGIAISIVSRKEQGRWGRILDSTRFSIARLNRSGGKSAAEPASVPSSRHGETGRGERGDRGGRGRRRSQGAGQGNNGRHHQGDRVLAEETQKKGPEQSGEDVALPRKDPPGGPGERSRNDAAAGDQGGRRRRGRRRGRGRGGEPQEAAASGRDLRPRRRDPAEPRREPAEPRREPAPRPAEARSPVPAEEGVGGPPGPEGEEVGAGAGPNPMTWGLDKLADKPKAPKQRLKLSDVGDDFFKTDYFEFDATLAERAEADEERPPPTPERARPQGAGHGPHRGAPSHPRPPAGHGKQGQPRHGSRSGGGGGAHHGHTAGGHTAGGHPAGGDAARKESPEGGRRRRRRRGRRGGGGQRTGPAG